MGKIDFAKLTIYSSGRAYRCYLQRHFSYCYSSKAISSIDEIKDIF